MLHIILQILSIIGIILLCILGLFIFLFFLVTLCPARYYVHGEKKDKDMNCIIKISYLFHLITIRYEYPKPAEPIVRIAGIRFYGKKKDKPLNEKNIYVQDGSDEIKAKTESKDSPAEFSTDSQRPSENIKETEKEVIKQKQSRLEKLCYTIKQFYGKMKHTIQDVNYYKEVLTNPANQALYSRLKSRLMVILKKIKPKYLKAYIVFGTGSPDTTGYACGLYGILIPIFGNQINLVPDFDHVVFDAEVTTKGYIRLMTVLMQTIKIYFDKQLWVFIKQLKRED